MRRVTCCEITLLNFLQMLCRLLLRKQRGSEQWSSEPPPSGQSAQQPPPEPHTAARLWDTEDFIRPPGAARTGRTLALLPFWYLVVERNFLWSSFPSRNFHLWFANMGSSCGFSRGNIVVMLLLLDGKVHHQLYCLRMKLEIMLKRCLSLKKKIKCIKAA